MQSPVATDGQVNLKRILDAGERIAVAVLYGFLVYRFFGTLLDKPANVLIVLSEGLIAAMVLFRRPTDDISLRPIDWATGFLGTALPMLFHPTGAGWNGAVILMAGGLLISLGAKLSLRRSFGIVAANRGVKSTGLYAAVRHPMYLGYLITYIGTLLLNPSVWNLILVVLWFGFEIIRIHAEERVLMRDEAYAAHAQKVRFRLIPGVW
ncbi:isoprenylcysteine carboxylmethyltransferase family protein [soil metagenome]